MSLQIWLPLTKDARNQGLSNILITPSLTYTDGKIGKAATGSLRIEDGNDLNKIRNFLNSGGDFSIAFWLKVTNATSGDIISYGNSTGTGTRLHIAVNSNVLRFGFRADDYDGATLTLNKWYHIVCSYSNSKKYMYIDGSLYGSKASGVLNIPQTYILFDLSKSNLNDFRIYDHCLSPMEVKELAKGLVLHYPLNRQGWGQNNLLKNSNFLQGTNGMQGYTATSATCTKQTDCMKVVSTSASGGFYSSNFDSIATGDMTTFSADVKANSNMTIYIGTDGSGNGSCQAYTVGTSWQRISISKAKTTNNANLRIYGNGTFYTKNLKYELGSIATSWCPNSSDELATTMGLNSTTEYDCSGFGNNGTRTGTFSWTSDTPRYNVSTNFDGSGIRIQSAALPIETKTISVWAKTTKNKNTAQCILGDSASGICMFIYGGGLITYFRGSAGGAGSRVTFGSEYKENDWNHLVVVKTGDTTRDAYCNGVKLATAANNFYTHAEGFWVGARNDSNQLPFYGQICDVRAYATALSADDIKSLYQNSAYIDSSGNVYGAVHEEV